MTGPGIYDMKAGITQIYFAIKALKVLNIPLNITPIIFINTDGFYDSLFQLFDKMVVEKLPLQNFFY